ncbi:MAG TPA: glycosyltransferase [Steroidobacteraceae bacterium]|nr:glycosyltransferase [Steroidobacteraceae bacterium]
MEAPFWLCVIAATYSYFWYPALLVILPPRKIDRRVPAIPVRKVAIVIAARNEASKIVEKLDNTLALERADVELDLMVASDASDDTTDGIVVSYAEKGIRLVRSPERKGKEHAQGLAIAATDADLIVFTDAGTILPKDALLHLLEAFGDPTVGAVSSVDRFISADGTLQGEGAYVHYEMWLRELESRFHSLVGLSGSFFAARRTVCQNWDDRVQSDFGTALSCVQSGMRATSDRRVIGYYKNISDTRKEYQRKLRTVTRGMGSLRIRAEVLNAFRYGRFSFEVFSHKVMRWATPWFLLGALGTNAALAVEHPFYQVLLVIQLAFYLSPVAMRIAPGLRKSGLARIGVYFVEVNVAILHAALLTLTGRTILTWEPSKR